MNGFIAEQTFETVQDAERWLASEARVHFPAANLQKARRTEAGGGDPRGRMSAPTIEAPRRRRAADFFADVRGA
jgi:hypothetical protein